MRRIELTWDDGRWGEGIAEAIVAELRHALASPSLRNHPWVLPDSVKVVREADPVYPDGEILYGETAS